LEKVSVYYDKIQVLDGISLNVDSNEVVALIGPNGAGKTTLVKTITGFVKPTYGKIKFDGKEIVGLPSHEIVKLGIAVVPEGGRVLPELSVIENLKLGAFTKEARKKEGETLEMVYNLFPILEERRNQIAGTLSGGEQRMLSIGRALMARPKLIIFDELSMGLAPKLVSSIYESIRQIGQQLFISMLIIEQYVKMALENSSRAYLLEYGKITRKGPSKELMNDEYLKKAYLGL
jgi:branched-chain amino acid transport system ATP-binding protein